MKAVIRCPERRHPLADLDIAPTRVDVTPRRVPVYGGDRKHRAHVVDDDSAAAGRFSTHAADPRLPVVTDVLVCRCSEYYFPDDLWEQAQAGHAVILAVR